MTGPAQLPTRGEMEAMLAATELKWRGARLRVAGWERELVGLTRSERRSRGGVKLVAQVENGWATLHALHDVLTGVREALGMSEPEAMPAPLLPCECERRPSKIAGLDEVVWSESCPLHGGAKA